MAKRRSVRQLNKDDPDDIDDEPEESGTFESADQREIGARKIVTAKRRIKEGTTGPSPLTSFAGFSVAPTGNNFQFFKKTDDTKLTLTKETEKSSTGNNDDTKNTYNAAQLKSLNMCFLDWIKQHLDKDPMVILLPVFKDYEQHLGAIKIKDDQTDGGLKSFFSGACPASKVAVDSKPSAEKDTTVFSANFSSTKSSEAKTEAPKFHFGMNNAPTTKVPEAKKDPPATFSFGLNSSAKTPEVKKDAPTFSFGLNTVKPAEVKATSNESSEEKSKPSFSFGISSTTTPAASAPAFSLGGGLTTLPAFSSNNVGTSLGAFANAAPPAAAATTNNAEEESDEPPVSDYVPVGEEGSVHSVERCKLFLKKGKQFDSIGVGQLHLKPLPSGKTQVIMRADTAQGNVLLNVILTPDMPLQKTGSNNVLLVCVPTPEAKPPPATLLIRVKGAEERDKLFSEMERLRS